MTCVGAIAQIGTFLQGGPLHDNPTLIAGSTNPGQVLDSTRLFVASTSNFGAPLALLHEAEGSILSIDVTALTPLMNAGLCAVYKSAAPWGQALSP